MFSFFLLEFLLNSIIKIQQKPRFLGEEEEEKENESETLKFV